MIVTFRVQLTPNTLTVEQDGWFLCQVQRDMVQAVGDDVLGALVRTWLGHLDRSWKL